MMASFDSKLIFLALAVVCFAREYDVVVRMPDVTPEIDEQYLCTAVPLDPDNPEYIVGYEPDANSHISHHMILYGCQVPGNTVPGAAWTCGGPVYRGLTYRWSNVCGTRARATLYAWALDAKPYRLPNDTAFVVGGRNNDVQYLVIQMHYLHMRTEPDQSGIVVKMTNTKRPKRAGMIVFGTGGVAKSFRMTNFDATCKLDEDIQLEPFAYRVHTHYLGQQVSGFIYRNGQWITLGQRSPQLPQKFNEIMSPIGTLIKKDDRLLVRCAMFNTKQSSVRVGYRSVDEMCNFYIMYSVDADTKLTRMSNCFSSGPPYWNWDYLDLKNKPIGF